MKKFKILLLSGGGIKGIGTASALEILYEKKILENINRIIGSSIGAFIGLMLCIDISPFAIRLLLTKIKFNELQNYNINSFIQKFGFDDASKFMELIYSILANKNIDKNITFEEFSKISKYDFTMIGTNLNLGLPARFNKDKTPKMKIIDALRISTCFPLIFTPLKIDGHYYADGGIVCPVECEGLTKKELRESLAIVIHKGFPVYKTNSLDQYISAIISNMADSLLENIIKKFKYKIIISIPVFAMDLNINDKQKEEMVSIGKNQALNFIKKIKPTKI